MILLKKVLGQSIVAWIVQFLFVLSLFLYNLKIINLSIGQMLIIFFVLAVLYILILMVQSKVKNKKE